MSGNTFGKLFKITTFGESHGEALGVVIDGTPSNIDFDTAFIQSELDRRKPGSNSLGTKRKEDDKIKVLSGVYKGKTTGTPLSVIVNNTNQNSSDYNEIETIYRPGHADYTYMAKYKIRDPRGGGRSSGRETLSRVIAGAVAKLVLKQYNIKITAGTIQVGNIKSEHKQWNPPFDNELSTPDERAFLKMKALIEEVRNEGDSIGGIIELHISSLPAGLGNPCFDKLDARLSYALMGLGAVKGIEFGSGFSSAAQKGSQNNDQMKIINGIPYFETNNAGGVLGGISTGEDVIIRLAVKPTPSIYKEQHSIDHDMNECSFNIKGRHDPCILPRLIVVTEAMAAITILDQLLIWRAYE